METKSIKREMLGQAIGSCPYKGYKILKWEDRYGQWGWTIEGIDWEFGTKEDAKRFIDGKPTRWTMTRIKD